MGYFWLCQGLWLSISSQERPVPERFSFQEKSLNDSGYTLVLSYQSAIFPFAPEKSVPREVLILISQPESKTTNSGMFFLKIFKRDMEVTDIFWRESKLN